MVKWSSDKDVLAVFRLVAPQMQSTGEEARVMVDRPIIKAFDKYSELQKLVNSYGQEFLDEHVDPDGKVRTNFDQVLTTGRVSSWKPNMQQIPAKDLVGNRYRNAFIPDPGYLVVDSDYSSQELVLIASYSRDEVWMKALREGKDLHSVCAEVVFAEKWKEGKGDLCEYYDEHTDRDGKHWPANSQQKCKCKEHKKMRTDVKTINFGLAYGMTYFKLAATAKISKTDAKKLIDKYFASFPGIRHILDTFGRFGVDNGYIFTSPPFRRIRFYPQWEAIRDLDDERVKDKELAAIDRASKNQPIQGTAADMVKTSMCMMRWYIKENQLGDSIKIVAQVHDQNTTICKEELAEVWKVEFDRIMCEAAAFVLPNGLLKAETNITPVWSK